MALHGQKRQYLLRIRQNYRKIGLDIVRYYILYKLKRCHSFFHNNLYKSTQIFVIFGKQLCE